VNVALGITFAGNFMPKHRLGNTDGNTELFRRVRSGEYCLAPDQQDLVDSR